MFFVFGFTRFLWFLMFLVWAFWFFNMFVVVEVVCFCFFILFHGFWFLAFGLLADMVGWKFGLFGLRETERE